MWGNNQISKLYKKWSLVRDAIGYMQKTGDMVQKDKKIYSYLQEAEVKRAVQKELKESGLILTASLKSCITGVRELKYPTSFAEVVITFTVIDVETGKSFSFDAPGFAHDSGDKAIYKAMAGAFKYAMTLNLQIPTGDDPEGDTAQHDNPPAKTKKENPLTDKEQEEKKEMIADIHAGTAKLEKGEFRSDMEEFVRLLNNPEKEITLKSIKNAHKQMKENLPKEKK